MLSDQQREFLGRPLMTMRIIVLAMGLGVLFFLAVALAVGGRPAEEPRLGPVALVLAAAGVVLAGLLPNWMARKALARGAWDVASESSVNESDHLAELNRLAMVYQTRLIVSVAILEGVAFVNLVAYVIEGQMLNIGAAVVLLLLMLIQIPSRRHLEDWLARPLHSFDQPASG